MIVAGPDEGYHLAAVKQVVQKFGLQRDFEFVGAVEGEIKERLYRCADLFILPSWSENFGNVVVEALSYGIPVITTHGTPWQELVTNRCGWWVDIGADSLAEAIQEATSLSDIQRQEMGRRGRSFVEKEFSSANFASKMVKAYSWILGFDSRPAYIM
jgi:glycosyltransferase involved in cell wall biosynthesis